MAGNNNIGLKLRPLPELHAFFEFLQKQEDLTKEEYLKVTDEFARIVGAAGNNWNPDDPAYLSVGRHGLTAMRRTLEEIAPEIARRERGGNER